MVRSTETIKVLDGDIRVATGRLDVLHKHGNHATPIAMRGDRHRSPRF